MAKTLCDYNHKEIIKKDFKTYRDLVHPGKCVCMSCGRVANSEDNLCDPKKLKKKKNKK